MGGIGTPESHDLAGGPNTFDKCINNCTDETFHMKIPESHDWEGIGTPKSHDWEGIGTPESHDWRGLEHLNHMIWRGLEHLNYMIGGD
ncbi:unnamed protein product, partial [Staurois parvus]